MSNVNYEAMFEARELADSDNSGEEWCDLVDKYISELCVSDDEIEATIIQNNIQLMTVSGAI